MRWLLSWTLYWLGDAVWRSGLDNWEWGADLYQWLMRRALQVQGYGAGPWLAVPGNHGKWE